MPERDWSEDWPEEKGWYWFCGWTSKCRYEDEARIFLVDVKKISNGFAYISGGRFLFIAEGAKGLWQKAVLPEFPDMSCFNDRSSKNVRSK